MRIVNTIVRIGREFSIHVGGERKQNQDGERELEGGAKALLFPRVGDKRDDAQQSSDDVDPEDPAMLADVAGDDQVDGS